MPSNDVVYYQATEDGSDTPRFSSARIFKVGAAVIGGACLVLLSIVALQNANVAESTDLVGMPTSLRSSFMQGIGKGAVQCQGRLCSLPGPSPWKELAIAALQGTQGCGRDVSAQAANARFNNIVANMDKKDLVVMAALRKKVQSKAATEALKPAPFGLEAGMVGPVKGLWDPFSLTTTVTEGELLYFREAELKHGRVCMLASLGFFVQEKFHPLFGGDIDVPAIQSVTQAPLALFWPAVLVAIGALEVPFIDRIDYATQSLGFTPALKPGVVPGDIGFDPLGLKPKEPEEYLAMQNREILHGRLGMIAAAGMIAQELVTQSKLDCFTSECTNAGFIGR